MEAPKEVSVSAGVPRRVVIGCCFDADACAQDVFEALLQYIYILQFVFRLFASDGSKQDDFV